jgi:hypothetical protein
VQWDQPAAERESHRLHPVAPQGNLVPAGAFLLIQQPLAVAGLRAIERTLVRGRV